MAISRAKTSIATACCSFSSVSQTWLSGMGISRKFRLRCKMVALLANRSFAVVICCGAAIEESVYYSAGVKQLRNETEMGTLLGHRQRTRRRGIEVGPLGRYEGATSVGQNQNQMCFALMPSSPKDRQCFPLKRVLRASNPHLLR